MKYKSSKEIMPQIYRLFTEQHKKGGKKDTEELHREKVEMSPKHEYLLIQAITNFNFKNTKFTYFMSKSKTMYDVKLRQACRKRVGGHGQWSAHLAD